MVGNVLVPYSLLLAVSVKVRARVEDLLLWGLRMAKCWVRTEAWAAGIRISVREVSGSVMCWNRNISLTKSQLLYWFMTPCSGSAYLKQELLK